MLASEDRPASHVIRRPDAGWFLSLYPSAGEAGGSFVSSIRRGGTGVPGAAVDPDRSRAEAARRAGVKVRRYCAANGLDRMGTLTYAGSGCHDPREVRADVAGFFRRLRGALGGDPFPYLWVPEWHPGGHGLHLHYAMGQYVARSTLADAWGHGWVNIKRFTNLPSGSGTLRRSRAAARYLSKYVSKSFDIAPGRERPAGLHRYEVAEGFQPRAVRLAGASPGEVLSKAAAVMGTLPSTLWWSGDAPTWEGPPAYWFAWDQPATRSVSCGESGS